METSLNIHIFLTLKIYAIFKNHNKTKKSKVFKNY